MDAMHDPKINSASMLQGSNSIVDKRFLYEKYE